MVNSAFTAFKVRPHRQFTAEEGLTTQWRHGLILIAPPARFGAAVFQSPARREAKLPPKVPGISIPLQEPKERERVS